jgi:TaqI-like C-terminal specificity domain/Eco57I restriction-modification methylase
MLNKENLLTSLIKPYSLPFFIQNILRPVFGANITIYASAVSFPVNPSEMHSVKWIKKYGKLKVTDYKSVDLYEVALQDKVVVERNKVSIGAVVKRLIAGNNAVLTNFYYPDKDEKNWRFSFVARDKIIEDGGIVAADTNLKRYTYVLGPNESCRTAAERFQKLSLNPEFDVEKLKEAFSVEKLSKKFFDEYKEHYEAFVKYLSKKETLSSVFNGDEKAARDFAKKLLGRIVFLYFVQKKGWLGASNEKWKDGNPKFMQDLFSSSGKSETFYPKWLRTLFYDALNNPESNANDFKLPDGSVVKVPYLNGGLFEDDDPKKATSLVFPPKLFEALFEFFEQYNFTIYEDSPEDHTIAVDPEMLGHIFENLLEDNKDKGAFYTPKEIVHYMCQKSLIQYLATKLDIPESKTYQELGTNQQKMFGNEVKKGQFDLLKEHKTVTTGITHADVEQFIKHKETTPKILEHAEEINSYLDAVKICDPAIGSGAFPMGLLHEIFNAKQLLKETAQVKALLTISDAAMKENIIQNSIYGVDIEKGAVDIARLRFWLSLIVDEESPRPLPNLDYKIVVGDSLLPKFEGEVVDIDWEAKYTTSTTEPLYRKMKADLQHLVSAQKKYFSVKKDKEKGALKQQIRSLKIEILLNQLHLDKAKYEYNAIANEELFESGKKGKEQKLENELKLAGFNSAIKKLEHLKKHPHKPLQFFDWKLDFPEILNETIASTQIGFDIVIGNPPYVFARESDKKGFLKSDKTHFYKKYSLAEYQLNLYPLFIEAGNNVLAHNGCFCFITPNNWLTINSNKKLRKFVLEQSQITIVNFYARVFDNADVDSSIVIYSKSERNKIISLYEFVTSIHFIKRQKVDYFLNQRDYIINVEAFKSEHISTIVDKVENNSIKLGMIAAVKAGLKAYEVGTGTPHQTESMKEKRVYHSKKKNDKTYYKYLDGKDVCRYFIGWSNEYLKYGDNLAAPRKDFSLFSTKRILVRQIPAKPPYCIHACLIEEIALNDLNSMNIINIQLSPEYVLGIINSKLISYWFINRYGKLQRGLFPQFKVNELSEFPLPNDDRTQKTKIKQLVNNILVAKKKNPSSDTSIYEREIDTMVYHLYNLSLEEARIIDPTVTEEEWEKWKV